ncbi:hypothetical protein DFH08DRAFT_812625 [Mycena albidolilacea]|uniref:Uncharacterized protein n=1 Tax=Mycena albidolilacea TaxID=1033008 RepID=A0AAD7ENC7_9AGAR|nr:hypothetical protein DFH08DRAFT_812625 [Mycena albidolilacea]
MIHTSFYPELTVEECNLLSPSHTRTVIGALRMPQRIVSSIEQKDKCECYEACKEKIKAELAKFYEDRRFLTSTSNGHYHYYFTEFTTGDKQEDTADSLKPSIHLTAHATSCFLLSQLPIPPHIVVHLDCVQQDRSTDAAQWVAKTDAPAPALRSPRSRSQQLRPPAQLRSFAHVIPPADCRARSMPGSKPAHIHGWHAHCKHGWLCLYTRPPLQLPRAERHAGCSENQPCQPFPVYLAFDQGLRDAQAATFKAIPGPSPQATQTPPIQFPSATSLQ